MEPRPLTPTAPTTAGTESTPGREPRVGDRVGPYPILGELGRGGMAIVFRSKDPVLPREIALKIMLPKVFETDPHAKARFLREAEAQARVDNPHVVVIYQAGEWNGVPYFAMPALKGRTLAALLKDLRDRKDRLPAAEVARIGREVAEGLEAAHAVGLVHRDIKPGNIWLEDPKRWVKLLDFGLAREESVADGAGQPGAKRRAVAGTPSYMSPEQAAGGAVDARTDLWSLGVVLYQMAAGEKPFTGATRSELIQAVVRDEPLPPDAPDLPPALVELILDLLAKHPDDRPRTATLVAEALAAIEKALHAPPVVQLPAAVAAPELWGALDDTEKDAPPKADRGAPRSRPGQHAGEPRALPWAWIAGGSVLGVLLLGGLIWLAVKPSKPKSAPKDETATPRPAGGPEKKPPEPKTKTSPPTPPPAPEVPTSDRKAAEIFHEKAALRLLSEGTGITVVRPGEPLPAGKFDLIEIDFGGAPLPADYLTGTFLPNVKALKSLVSVHARPLRPRAEHFRAMAEMPFHDRLTTFISGSDLTPEVLAVLARFPSLLTLGCRIEKPDDALFARLGELKLKALVVENCSPGKSLTGEGWESLGKLPLKTLCFIDCRLDKVALRGLAAKGRQRVMHLVGGSVEENALLELSHRPTELKELTIWELGGVGDKDLLHLAKVPSLTKLVVCGGAVTEKGVKELRKERPGLQIDHPPKGAALQIQIELPPTGVAPPG